jgi:hypothetical protein
LPARTGGVRRAACQGGGVGVGRLRTSDGQRPCSAGTPPTCCSPASQ